MLDEAAALPDDPDDLRALAERLIAEVKAQAVLIEKLRHQLAGHRAHRFGASAETADQLQLALETSELAAAAMTAKLRLPEPPEEKGKPKRRPIPDHVPRTEIELLPAQDDCAACGGRLRQLGEDVTEELEYVPGRLVVNRITRPRFACSGCDGFTQAPLPSRPVERGRPGPGLLAHVLVSRYADHLPLYRQSQVYAREGIDLDRSTLADRVGKSTALLEPRAEGSRHPRGRHARADARAGHRQDADGAALDLCARRAAVVRTRTAVLRAFAAPQGPRSLGPLYRFSVDRKGSRPAKHLAGFKGWMQADGYAGFEELSRGGDIREGSQRSRRDRSVRGTDRRRGRLAHVRRKFVDVYRSQGSAIAEEAIARIAELYAVEKAVRGAAPEERVQARQEHATPVFEALEAWLAEQLPALSGKTPLAAAIRYALNRLPRLRPYLADGSLEIDNNAAERAMRGCALGRKNWLFAGSAARGKALAIAATLSRPPS